MEQIKTVSPLSVLYNDVSVLENHHIATAFRIMQEPGCNIFASFEEEDFLVARKIIIDMVMSTDMVKHTKFLGEFRAHLQATRDNVGFFYTLFLFFLLLFLFLVPPLLAPGKRIRKGKAECGFILHLPSPTVQIFLHSPEWHILRLAQINAKVVSSVKEQLANSYEERVLVLCNIVHSADLGAAGKPWELCEKWTYRLMEEFYGEGDAERKLGLELGALNDREKLVVPKSQVGFINFIALPLWEAWGEYVDPGTDIVQLRNIRHNLSMWQELADRCTRAGAPTASQPPADKQHLQDGNSTPPHTCKKTIWPCYSPTPEKKFAVAATDSASALQSTAVPVSRPTRFSVSQPGVHPRLELTSMESNI